MRIYSKSWIIPPHRIGKGKTRSIARRFTDSCSSRFIARIEEVLSEWKLNGPESSNTEVDFGDGEWIETNETLEFGDHSYTITHFSLQIPETLQKTPVIDTNNAQMTTSVSFEKQSCKTDHRYRALRSFVLL